MFNQKKWFVLFAALFLGVAAEIFAPEETVKTAAAAARAEMTTLLDAGEQLDLICTEDVWKEVLAGVQKRDLALMANSTDHIVTYHGERFAITEDDYQVLIRIVEAEAGGEDIKGRMLVANVILNRLEIGFGGRTISDVVFAKGQFAPIADGRFFKVTPSETTIEAVERVLDGEDYSDGALYFMCRELASKRGIRWFDKNLKFMFKHGCHEFYVEKK
ncbi:MAG: cell wall hydrolase [Lachnospiraceae bacterium]|nr:cell wall hydrolase [Lachnospiraceae bacterium]